MSSFFFFDILNSARPESLMHRNLPQCVSWCSYIHVSRLYIMRTSSRLSGSAKRKPKHLCQSHHQVPTAAVSGPTGRPGVRRLLPAHSTTLYHERPASPAADPRAAAAQRRVRHTALEGLLLCEEYSQTEIFSSIWFYWNIYIGMVQNSSAEVWVAGTWLSPVKRNKTNAKTKEYIVIQSMQTEASATKRTLAFILPRDQTATELTQWGVSLTETVAPHW